MLRVALLSFTLLYSVHAQVAESANRNYQTQDGRAGLLKTLGAPDRDAVQKPVELVASLGIRPGMTVADIGTGPGYMLPHLSAAVGPSGKVLAEDIFDDFLGAAQERVKNAGLKNVSFIKGNEHSPQLPAGIDLIFALDSYHHYNYPREMLQAFRKALKMDGRLAVVEYYRRPGAMPNGDAMTHLRLDDAGVVKEIEAAGFRLLEKRETIPNSQYLCVFRLGAR